MSINQERMNALMASKRIHQGFVTRNPQLNLEQMLDYFVGSGTGYSADMMMLKRQGTFNVSWRLSLDDRLLLTGLGQGIDLKRTRRDASTGLLNSIREFFNENRDDDFVRSNPWVYSDE